MFTNGTLADTKIGAIQSEIKQLNIDFSNRLADSDKRDTILNTTIFVGFVLVALISIPVSIVMDGTFDEIVERIMVINAVSLSAILFITFLFRHDEGFGANYRYDLYELREKLVETSLNCKIQEGSCAGNGWKKMTLEFEDGFKSQYIRFVEDENGNEVAESKNIFDG